jgi:hypothetical protein
MSKILLSNGKLHDLANPWATDPDITVIAHALANLCRWTGHTRRFYSVAEHSLRVANLVPAKYKLQALLHDAAEAYIGDIATPLGRLLGPNWDDIKRDHDRWIWYSFISSGRKFTGWPAEVQYADHVMLATEARDLLVGSDAVEWGCPPLEGRIALTQPYDMATLFFNRFKEYRK